MDYDLKLEIISLGEVKHVQPPPVAGTGDAPDGPLPPLIDEVVDIKIIKKALSKESSNSCKTKIEMVRLLVEAGADASIKNNHGYSSLVIAKNLSESSKIVKMMEAKMKGNGWNKWF
jgi:hypothetical protein